MAILRDHRSILKKMLQLLEKDGADSVREQVSEDRAEYRDALVGLVKASRQDPKRLRQAVRDHLESLGCTTSPTQNTTGNYWLTWTDRELEETSRLLGGESGFLNWD